MFNMYQELVDRIDELLKERKEQQKLIEKLKRIYLRIPFDIIEELTAKEILTKKEKDYWIKLYSIMKNDLKSKGE